MKYGTDDAKMFILGSNLLAMSRFVIKLCQENKIFGGYLTNDQNIQEFI